MRGGFHVNGGCRLSLPVVSLDKSSYISTRLFPLALPCVATFSDTGTFVCPSARLRLSLVFGGDFFLSPDFAFGISAPLLGPHHNAIYVRRQYAIIPLYSPNLFRSPHGQKTSRFPSHSRKSKD